MTDRRTFLKLAGAGVALGAAPAIARDPKPVHAGRPDTSLGKHVLRFSFPGLRIGSARYESGPTGCTVFRFDKPALAIADIRGGAPGTVLTDRLRDQYGLVDAICFAGGSLYGLEAMSGVASEFLRARSHKTGWNDIAIVTGAILYDFPVRENAIHPDLALGRAALRAARPDVFPMGARGAGAGASCGKWLYKTTRWEFAGQGAAYHASGKSRFALFTVVNALGAIHDRTGRVVRGHVSNETGKRIPMPDLRKRDVQAGDRGGNTTLTLLVTNQKLSAYELRQIARETHDSMSRAIRPFHTLTDGDVFYAVTTNAVRNRALNPHQCAAITSELAWDAVLRSFTGRS